ncbi:hypothetical protein [Novosphingobium sp.]|uniref:hypothetical protein n=1 Tax=Novosphingobium sp. TaxID=1874826 RepID=UPI003D0F165C
MTLSLLALVAGPAWADQPAPADAAARAGHLPAGATIGGAEPMTIGTLRYATLQNSGGAGQVGGNYAALQFSPDHSESFYRCYKNRATAAGGRGVPLQPGDDLCELQGNGWDGATYNTSGTFDFAVDGPVSPKSIPTSAAIWLGSAAASGVRGNTLALLLDSHANAYLRNGFLGIGPTLGFNPPAVYARDTAPPYPLSIVRTFPGTALGAYIPGAQGGGARIAVSNGYSTTAPVYGFAPDVTTGIGSPASGMISFIARGREVGKIAPDGNAAFTGTLMAGRARLLPTRYASLLACNDASAGTLAYITDAPTAISARHQPVAAGGGTNRAFIACNGTGWHAFDY